MDAPLLSLWRHPDDSVENEALDAWVVAEGDELEVVGFDRGRWRPVEPRGDGASDPLIPPLVLDRIPPEPRPEPRRETHREREGEQPQRRAGGLRHAARLLHWGQSDTCRLGWQ